jgi:hypothetical protein
VRSDWPLLFLFLESEPLPFQATENQPRQPHRSGQANPPTFVVTYDFREAVLSGRP